MKIQSTDAVELDRAKLVIYGPPGAGKTSLAASTGGPTLIISMESGLLSLGKAKELYKSKGMVLDYVDVTIGEKGELLNPEQRLKKFKEIYFELLNNEEIKQKYEFIVIDSISELAHYIMKWLEPQYTEDMRGLYGEFPKEMFSILLALRDLPNYHVIFLAHSENSLNDDGAYSIRLALPGKVIHTELPRIVDGIYYYYVTQDKDGVETRKLVTRGKEKSLVAKERGGRLDKAEEPNIQNIIKKLKGEKHVSGSK